MFAKDLTQTSNTTTGEPQTFTVSVTPQANYPLDLYILMDLSASMSDDLDSISRLSVQLG